MAQTGIKTKRLLGPPTRRGLVGMLMGVILVFLATTVIFGITVKSGNGWRKGFSEEISNGADGGLLDDGFTEERVEDARSKPKVKVQEVPLRKPTTQKFFAAPPEELTEGREAEMTGKLQVVETSAPLTEEQGEEPDEENGELWGEEKAEQESADGMQEERWGEEEPEPEVPDRGEGTDDREREDAEELDAQETEEETQDTVVEAPKKYTEKTSDPKLTEPWSCTNRKAPWTCWNNTVPMPSKPREAFATLLTTRPKGNEEDRYFLTTRLLIDRLRRDPKTRSNPQRDIIVLVTPVIDTRKRKILTLDGATIKEVNSIIPHNYKDVAMFNDRWVDCFTKMHLWNLTQYDSLFYMDGDVLPLENLDFVFTNIGRKQFGSPPEFFDFAAPIDMMWGRKYLKTFSAGMMLFRPSADRLASLLQWAEAIYEYDTNMMEQGLLNYYYGKHYVQFAKGVSGNFVDSPKIIEDERLKTVHEKYWVLSESGAAGEVRRLFTDGIAGLPTYTEEDINAVVL
ncbi:hypothetical protein HK097_008270 [Rhizophlyctis rosea]|uniref:Uncharacterized protein n=1 Tax=Rhizophlyctis rosea TaxID=64517 RepID=A0AAD5SCK2_9FUNG|nr:hypothetical protein HK097_008270 [Rhizophlyctis rosea]